MHFKECSKPFPKWFSDTSIHKICFSSNHCAEGVPSTQETTVVARRRALANKLKQAMQEEEKATNNAAQEDAAEEEAVEQRG